MNRDLAELTPKYYDILIVGGGIYGACIAWEAALSGLTVALIAKADFGSATTASSIDHGGWRNQQANWRQRESIRAHRKLIQIAPHLVQLLPVLMPTYGQGIWGKALMSASLTLTDLLSSDRHQLAPQQQIPRRQLLSRPDCLQLLPGINSSGITGGAVFYDVQADRPERLVLAFLHSAVQAGATIANYVEVTQLIQSGDRIIGVVAQDRLTGKQLEIRARTVVNTTGDWNQLLDLPGRSPLPPVQFTKAINLVTRQLFETYAVGVVGQTDDRDPDVLVNQSDLLFITPWRDKSLIGTKYSICKSQSDHLRVTESEVQAFLSQINQAYPAAQLTLADVEFVHQGLLPGTGNVLAKPEQIYDYRDRGISGLLSVVGDKSSAAIQVATKVVQRVLQANGRDVGNSTAWQLRPLYGGRIENFAAFLQAEIDSRPVCLSEVEMRRLIYNYGSAYPAVLQYWWDSSATDKFAVTRAEVLHGVREEMAQTLADVVFRRTEVGTGNPDAEVLRTCAETMSAELGWSSIRTQQELQLVNQVFAWGNWSQKAIAYDLRSLN